MPGLYHPLVENWKSLIAPVSWSAPDSKDQHIGFLAPLDIDGVTIAELALRGGAYDDLVDRAVTLQLEIGHSGLRGRIPLIRLDWRPISPVHKNPNKGPIEHRRKVVFGTHRHPFEANWIENEQRMLMGNLPVAIEISPDIQSFSDFLDYAKILFRINNIDQIPGPEWSPKLI